MRRAADAACDAADANAAAASGAGPGALPLSASEWAAVAREAFPADGGNDFGHLRLSDFSDAVNALPREELAAAMEGGGGMADVQASGQGEGPCAGCPAEGGRSTRAAEANRAPSADPPAVWA